MKQFNSNKWFKNQYLQEANLNENQASQAAQAINQAIAGVDESLGYSDFAKAVATILKDEYGTHNFNPFMEVLHAELGMEESLNEAEEMATYKVEIVVSDDDGGPSHSEDVEVKVDASLSGDDLRDAVRDAIRKEGYNRKNIYKFKYEKA